MKENTLLSVVIPIYCEEENLPFLYSRLVAALEQTTESYEIIFVNDCSKDNSLEMLKNYNRENPKVKILSFSRNFGHQTAITAGLNFSSGQAVVIIDGDLQDPPELIPQFVEKWKDGYDVVYGIRIRRKGGIIKRCLYKLYYILLKKLSKIDIPPDSGDCCIMGRRVVNLLNKMPERNRFVRGLRSWVGFKQIGLEYVRDKRYAGKAKYTFLSLLKLGLDGIVSFSEIPLKASIFVGSIIAISSVIYSLVMVFNRIWYSEIRIPGWTSIVVSITFLGGIQLIVMGLLGEYIIRIFDEVKGRPFYILNCSVGFEHEESANISDSSSLQC